MRNQCDGTNSPPRYNSASALVDYVEENARRHPDAPAILLADGRIAYADLMVRVHAAGAALVGLGVGPGAFVGLHFSRGADNIVALLAALRAGACAVPLDPAYSDAAQLRQIVGQVPFAAILQAAPGPLAEGCEAVADAPRLALSAIGDPGVLPAWPQTGGGDPACMVFTSGTTGTPKGVVLLNRGLAAFTLDQPVIGLRADDIMLHASSLACDGGLIEVWSALLAGAALAVVETPRPALSEVTATMRRHAVTATSQYVGMHNLLIAHDAEAFATVRLAMAGGDVHSPEPLRALKRAVPGLRMVNIYGPSETTCISLVHEIGMADLTGGPIPIGRPLAHEHAFVVNETLAEVPDGTTGELLIGGDGVAAGYYGLPERTAEGFIDDPRPGHTGRVYRTGDVALRRPDGVFEFFGRADRQIKLGGRRIELEGIEHIFRNAPGVHLAAVEAITGPNGDRRIGMALQPAVPPTDEAAFIASVLDAAHGQLHAQFLPRHVLVMAELPVTPMGKPDRKAVRAALEALLVRPAASRGAQTLARPAVDAAATRQTVARIWDDILACGPLSDDATFFEAGGTSLQLIEAHGRIERALGLRIDLMLLFEKPRLGDLAAALAELAPPAAPEPAPEAPPAAAPHETQAAPVRDGDIAIVGYAARVPGARTLADFWAHQRRGDNLIARFTPEELEDDPVRRTDPHYVPARGVLDDVDMFDARFFGILPAEADLIDPQARVFLEMCVEALDAAALDPARARGRIGVFAGSSTSTYLLHNVLADRARLEDYTTGFQIDNYTTLTGNITDTLSSRVAYKLDLKGPAVTVHTACSTSLTAIAQAVMALRTGQCEAALAGGISITFPQHRGYLAQDGGMSSGDGLCRPFDARAGGTVFGHGGGVVVLKPLAAALADGDRIEGVIRGIGLSNDGADKMSFTAPSVAGQAAAIRAAQADADIVPEDVSFIECHGTATPLGDPIEVRALSEVFAGVGHPVALGSVKGNIGHLDAGAGAVSVIRTLQALNAREFPPVANFTAPNPRIDFASGPFTVPDAPRAWQADGPRIAGISGFGIGGTNAHIVVQEPPRAPAPATAPDPVQILPLSAKSPEALALMAETLADVLRAPTPPALADVALTLQEGRTAHPYRLAIAADSPAEAAERLLATPPRVKAASAAPVAFLFPGQGTQYPGMGSGLYATAPTYARWIDAGCEVLAPLLGTRLRPFLTGEGGDPAILRGTALAQPALFVTQYALAQEWLARGVRPSAVLGHSIGEFAAATVAGVFGFEDAARVVAARGRLMAAEPAGAMLAVRTTAERLAELLPADLDLAAGNAPQAQVVAGPEAAIETFARTLEAEGIACRRLHTSHAFHSRAMEPVVGPLAGALADLALRAPEISMISAVTGAVLTPPEATDPRFWASEARAPVRFAAALATLGQERARILLEVGCGQTLSTFAGQTLPRERVAGVVQSLPDHARAVSDAEAMASATARLWAYGTRIGWSAATRRGARKLALPGTVFMRRRHWIDAPPIDTREVGPHPATLHPATLHPATPQSANESPAMTAPQPAAPSRLPRLIAGVARLLSGLSGEDLTPADADTPFLELGFDSLFMGQMAQAFAREYGVEMSFRSLLTDWPSIAAVAAHLDGVLPPETVAPVAVAPETAALAPLVAPPAAPAPVQAPAPAAVMPAVVPVPMAPVEGVAGVLQAQMQTMQALFTEQLRLLGRAGDTVAVPAAPAAIAAPAPAPAVASLPAPAPMAAPPAAAEAPAKPEPLRFGRGAAVGNFDLTPEQRRFTADLVREYSARFKGSKAHTQENRAAHADPRTVAGFRAEWKEMIFPLVAAKAKGAFIEDIDGNRLIDLVNGFGAIAFGHSPDFVTEAVARQLERGFPIGPQTDMAGPTAARFARMAGHERATFCNTGSEAVMAAMRLARAVTGRQTVVTFSNDYHGQFDEVLVKARTRGEPAALPIAPGIPHESIANMVVLPWNDPAALDWIGRNAGRIAAVVVEPVQSRHPEVQAREFVRELRRLTTDAGAALVMDEVVTGFRAHPRGMQGLWGIEADMATYGKVVGGGLPVGMLAGRRRFMDALDGGAWGYGDDSAPQVAPTFFAGTFVRHPLVVAAVAATLAHLEAEGDALWSGAAARAKALAGRMNAALEARGIAPFVTHFSSWFVMNASPTDPRATLLYPLMRLEGVHVLDGFCGFLTTQHGEAECAAILAAFERAVDRLQSVGILAPAGGVLHAVAPAPASVPDPVPEVAAITGPVPLTESQREIWMTHQLGDEPAACFNESVSLRIEGALDHGALTAALGDLVARHDALRARFAPDGMTFEVAAPAPVPLPLLDHSDGEAEAALAAALDADARLPVDIVGGVPFRASLHRMGAGTHVLVLTAHHIVCDGWSYNTLATELALLYTARQAGRTADLPPAPSFAAFAAARAGRELNPATAAFWKRQFADIPPLPELPTDRPRASRKSYAGATAVCRIDVDLVQRLRKAGARHGATLFATLFAGLQITLGRLAGTGQVVLGVPTGGHALLDNQGLVGHLVNFLPIRADFAMDEPASAHLRRTGAAVPAAFEHGDTTFGQLVRTLDVPRNLSRLPLTEVQFNLERVPEDLAFGAARATMSANPKAAVNFDLFFNMIEGRDGLRVDIDYNTDLFDRSTVERWVGHLECVLAAMAEAPETAVADLPLMTRTQESEIAERWNRSARAYDREALVHDLVFRTAARMGGRTALIDAAGILDYAGLAARIDALAAYIQSQVPGEGERIAIALPRTREMVVAMLAVLRAGHAYVPLNPDEPSARHRLVLETARVAGVIAEPGSPLAGEGRTLIDPAAAVAGAIPAPRTVRPEDTAYVIFTSGSTGTPKGVEIPHRAVVNFIASMTETPGFTPDDRILAVTTISFDIAVLELIVPLTVGASIEIASREDVLDGFRLVERVGRGDITVMQATPTLWGMLVEVDLSAGPGLRILSGGEPLPADLAARLTRGGATLWNLYGPTETTIWSALARVTPGRAITIGAPVANTELHVLDATGRLCPPGVPGELNIGGDGLAIGYFGRPDLTARAFREVDVAGRRVRLYATGDSAVRDADGNLRVLGRRDGQVKLRGFRIELGEIETRLRAQPGVRAAAVALRTAPGGQKRLVGYFVGSADSEALQTALVADLPDYMVPTVWHPLDALPQTANGKLDRKALPEPDFAAPRRASADLPETPTEKALAAIWCEVLGVPEIPVTETVFAMGIDSLAVFRLAARMMAKGHRLEARHVLLHPSLRELAAFADQRGEIAPPSKPSVKDFLRKRPA